ncbi:MAG: gamma-glutamyl-phosphate reductase, partial [Oscillospiraceae bacterium]|nr:gamma-glutamyl-phosphate reductase [Oscillospiraceae bacterium]
MTELEKQGAAAKDAAYTLAVAGTERKNAALLVIADALEARAADWLAANAEDVAAARKNGMTDALLD